MSLKLLSDYDRYVAENLADYCRRLRCTPSLTDQIATTLRRSIEHGDGALWSDSFLICALIDEHSSLRAIFDRFPGYRSAIVLPVSFEATLSTKRLEVGNSFQSGLNEELFRWAWDSRHEGTQLDEPTLLWIELNHALADYQERYDALASFQASIARPLYDLAEAASKEHAKYLYRLATLLEDTVAICFMAHAHPFHAFRERSQPVSPAFIRKQRRRRFRNIADAVSRDAFPRARHTFYVQLRDIATVPFGVLEDGEFERVIAAFRYEEFSWLCDAMDDPMFSGHEFDDDPGFTDEEYDDPETVSAQLYDEGLYMASLLWRSDLPLSSIARRLNSWRCGGGEEALWPASSKLVISLGERYIQAHRMDITTPTTLAAPEARAKKSLAEAGIWAPSPLWTDSVIERFEHLLASSTVLESDIQSFFEVYPDFILDDLHIEAFPQVVLFQDVGPMLRPDFLLRRTNSQFVDILELKRPNVDILRGTPRRPCLASQVTMAIAQLREYRNWFRDPSHRRCFRAKYGLDGFEPRLTLIIGRKPAWADEVVLAIANSGAEATVMTYDDLLAVARSRRRWLAR